jgi:hypothetical protein
MIARRTVRGSLLASFVSFHAGLAFAQPTPAGEKPAGEKPTDVKPAEVQLEETKPAPGATPSDGAASPSTDDAGETDDAEADAESKPKKSRGLEFIETRRKTVKDDASDGAPDAESSERASAHPQRDKRPEPDDGLLGTHQAHLFLGIGPRVGFISDEGLDPFSDTDAFSQVAIFGGSTLFTDGQLSLAVLAEWDYGQRSATARGLPAELGVHRVSLGAEGRYHVLRRLYGYVRVAPGALYTWARLNQLETDVWAFSADASLGAAFELFGAKSGDTNKPRGWVSLNGGYGFATDADLELSPTKDSNTPERTASVELDALSMSGPFVGGAVSLSY